MKKILFLSMAASLLLFFSCSSEQYTGDEPETPQSPNAVNGNGNADGVAYSLRNLTLNPDVVVLNSNNATLVSSEQELADGIVKVNSAASINAGDVLYIRTGEYTSLKKVSSIKKNGSQTYELQTVQAHLGELFQGGEITLSVDMYEAAKAFDAKNPGLRSTAPAIDKMYDFNLMEEYQWGEAFKFNPSTNLKVGLYMSMSFGKSQILPSQMTTYFEIRPTMNPLFSFAGSVNETYSDDIVRFIPEQLIDFLKQQEFDIDIPINVLGIESIPAKVKIKDINIPTTIEANLAKATDLTFGVNGSYKMGYTLDINGLNAKFTPIYENSIGTKAPSASQLQGELLTNTEVIIVPDISMLDGLYKITGDIVFGFKSETNSNVNTAQATSNFGSKGVFSSRMTVLVDLLIMKLPVEIFNSDEELWNIGTFNKQLTFSDLSWKVSSKYTSNILLVSRMYETDFSVSYKYSIPGKKIPGELFISYDVYQDNNSTKIQTVTDQSITPENVTSDSFTFKLNIPYKNKIISYQTKSYLKNIVIRDHNGYVYEGIYNTSKGINENSFAIQR